MSSLYPSLEDMGVDHLAQAQRKHEQPQAPALTYPAVSPSGGPPPAYGAAPPAYSPSSLYPSLDEYMGLTPEMMQEHMQVVAANQAQDMQVGVHRTSSGNMQVAPVSGGNVGMQRAEVKQGVRQIQLCKDGEGKVGLRVRSVNKGIFVAFIHKNSPAALAGLRFGDQILQINGQNCAGWDTDKAMSVLKKAAPEKITCAVRDRPFERTITMQKDSTGHVGFVFKNGKITAIVKDSSAARNGILTEHQLIEVDGQNVVGLKDKETGEIIEAAGRTVTITIIPSFIYDHIIKSMGSSLVKKFMDHSIPDI
jgi:syntenin-1